MSKFLLDECMSPKLVAEFWDRGMDTIHVRDRGMLGASDREVWRFSQSDNRTICTVNYSDFRRLGAVEKNGHAGVIAIASGANPVGQFDMVRAALEWLRTGSNSGIGFLNRYLEVDESGQVVSAEVHYGEN